jgi:PAS domain S-box-containing protein
MSVSSLMLELRPNDRPNAHTAEAILEAVVFGAHTFLNDPDWSKLLPTWLQRLGEAADAGQVRIFQNDDVTPNDCLTSSLYAEWNAPGVVSSPPEMLQHVSFRDVGCGRWIDILSCGEVIAGNADELPASEQPILKQEGVVAVAIVPVFSGALWWGFIGFSDSVKKREWTASEIHALSAAAGILGAAVARRDMERRIAKAVAQERLAAEIGEVLTATTHNLDDILEICCARIVHHLRVDVVRVWTVNRGGNRLRSVSAALGLAEWPATDLEIGSCAVGRIAQNRVPDVWRGELPELWPGSTPLTAAAELKGGAGLPLQFQGKLVGVVVMLTRNTPADEALEGLFSITDELALAIERSHAQSALHLSENRFQRLVESTLEGICIHDGQRIHDVNPSLAAMVGLDVASVIGRSPLEFIHPDSRAEAVRHIAMNDTSAYEAYMLRVDGTMFPAEVQGRNFMHDGVNMRVTSIRDLTERKAAERIASRLIEEQNAREAAERDRAQAEFMADASRILSSSFDTTTTLTQLAHLSVRFLAECCVVTLFDGGRAERIAAVHADPEQQPLLDAAMAELSDIDAVAARLCWQSVMTVPIASGGESLGSILFAIGDSRPQDPAGHAMAEELGRRTGVALQSARSYRDAQAATIARDEMLAVVAHDLRNPLNTISMGSSMMLEMTDASTPGRRQFEIIQRSAEHMNRLIQDLLDATRLQSGQLALEQMPTAVHSIVDEAMEVLQPLATHAGIVFESQLAVDLPKLLVDRMRVVQVLSNLVGNAIKFTPRGGHVTLLVNHDPLGAAFCVRDTGAGIAADQLPHIFGRFWQARRTDRRGLGLGLAIAKGIVEAHGGQIWVESVLGSGSDFLFTLPQYHAGGSI